jgi:short-subunit dehydrogenase
VVAVVADVGVEEDVRRIAKSAIECFGGFDSWVNNAGVSIYGRLQQVPLVDQRRLFDTNFWGVVHGSRVALEHLRHSGGALINVGSVLSDRAVPLQGTYCASKHAVKGFTDALRMEVEKQRLPVSITLIKPSAIDTPYRWHARNYMAREPKNPAPVYAPDLVAEAILDAARHPRREVIVGGGGKALVAAAYYMPRILDHLMKLTMFKGQQMPRVAQRPDRNSLYAPSRDLRERGGYGGHVARSSLYTKASRHPVIAAAILFGAGFAIASLVAGSKRKRRADALAAPVHTQGMSPFRTTRGWTAYPMPTH